MKAAVHFFGTLRQEAGTASREISLPDGARLCDLLEQLGLSGDDTVMASAGGRVLKAEDRLPDGAPVRLFNVLSGG